MAYKKGKLTPHYILIVGVNKNGFICQDMMLEGKEILPFDDFRKGIKELLLFDVLEEGNTSIHNKIDFMKKGLYRISNEKYDIYDNMRGFADKINNYFDINLEIEGYEPYKYAPIFTWLKGVAVAREKYACVLSKLQSEMKNSEIDSYRKTFMGLSKEWRHIIIFLFKAVYSNNTELIYRNIAKKIYELSDIEKNIVNELYKNL